MIFTKIILCAFFTVSSGILYKVTDLVGQHIDIVLNGEHLDDLLFDLHGKATRNTLLVIHTSQPTCFQDAQALLKTLSTESRHSLPGPVYLSMLVHDDQRARSSTWFDYTEAHNIKQHFNITTCPSVVFIREGQVKGQYNKMEYGPVSQTIESLIGWTWAQLDIQVMFINHHTSEIVISVIDRKTNNPISVTIAIQSEHSIACHVSSAAFAYSVDTGEFLGGWIVRMSENIIVYASPRYYNQEKQWRLQTEMHERQAMEELDLFRWSHAERHFNVLSQPILVPNFTALGFVKVPIPSSVYSQLLDYYNQHMDQMEQEYYPQHFTVWNLNEVDIWQVTLPADISSLIANKLKPIVQDWCRCSLVQTNGPGIVTRVRKYPRGSRVRMHVDELQSGHVIGTILHITRQLDLQSDWPLVVVDFSGKRHTIYMDVGEMILFESSRVIHGRPSVLKGDFYVNTFFYYQPEGGWDYTDWIGMDEATTQVPHNTDTGAPNWAPMHGEEL